MYQILRLLKTNMNHDDSPSKVVSHQLWKTYTASQFYKINGIL